jgi:hypothetical protein
MDDSFWSQIIENDYAIPDGYALTTLTQELFSYLGTPQKRYTAYNILEQWIREQNLYADAELDAMIDELLTYLRQGIGESGTDSVLLRSFSIWILTFILQRDAKSPFLTEARFRALLDQMADYMRDERDFRGWIEGGGWGHITAHIASLFGVMVENRYADRSTLERILTLIAGHMIQQTDTVYAYGEDDRMAQTVCSILMQNRVDIAFLRGWLKKIEAVMELASEGMPFDIRIFHAYINARNFVRSLYFPIELCVPEKPAAWEELRPALLDAIKEIGLC